MKLGAVILTFFENSNHLYSLDKYCDLKTKKLNTFSKQFSGLKNRQKYADDRSEGIFKKLPLKKSGLKNYFSGELNCCGYSVGFFFGAIPKKIFLCVRTAAYGAEKFDFDYVFPIPLGRGGSSEKGWESFVLKHSCSCIRRFYCEH